LDKDVDMASDLGKAMFRVNCAPSGSVFASLRRDTRDDPGLLLGTRKHTPNGLELKRFETANRSE
jgi:hypothetical protein